MPTTVSGNEKKTDAKITAREVVLEILLEREKSDAFSSTLIKDTLDRYASLPLTQRSFIKRLTEGTIERQIELDKIIRDRLKDPKMRVRPVIRCILRMSVYQILYMDAVTDYAACDEAVRLVKKSGHKSLSGFVNAVLRQVCRDKETLLAEAMSDIQDADIHELSARFSIPEFILKLWEEDYGDERMRGMLPAFMEPRPVCIRISASCKGEDRNRLIRAFEKKGAQVIKTAYAPDAYLLKKTSSIAELPGFKEGLFTVQDESSQIACLAAGLKGNELVLDLCAAPGGKSIYMAELAPKGKVYAFDVTREKIEKIRENAIRMHVRNLAIGVSNAAVYHENREEKADVVLCDVPCSGLGVITRKRDIKYNVDQEKIEALTQVQKKILDQAVRYVRPGGILVYSTCTINKAENDLQTDYILSKGMVPDDLTAVLPDIPGIEGCRLQMFPDIHKTDGFFVSRFKKPLKNS